MITWPYPTPMNSAITKAAAPMIGGMICPPVEATASTPAAKCGGKPDRFISGMAIGPSTMTFATALPEIVRAVGNRIEVHMDGGIRSGQDVIKAIALGAKGVYIGRAYTYGLGAMGEEGVTKALEIIRKELDLTMALCGHRDIRNVTSDILVGGGTTSNSAPGSHLRAIG